MFTIIIVVYCFILVALWWATKHKLNPNTVTYMGDEETNVSRILTFSPNWWKAAFLHPMIKSCAIKNNLSRKCDLTRTNVHLLGWRLSTLDFVAGFIIRGRFFAVVFSRGVRSRTTVRVRSRPRVRGTGISPLPGTTRWVRFITARRVLTQTIVNERMWMYNPVILIKRGKSCWNELETNLIRSTFGCWPLFLVLKLLFPEHSRSLHGEDTWVGLPKLQSRRTVSRVG